MGTFTASNGIVVDRDVHGCATARGINSLRDETQALREFFLAERDQELGRWRCPENPNYVVYPKSDNPRYVKVLNESDGLTDAVHAESPEIEGRESHRVASAYFAAHPVPKPWHDAKPGEVWVLSTGAEGEDHAWTVDPDFGTARFVYVGGLSNLPVDHPDITDGRRIWPEVE